MKKNKFVEGTIFAYAMILITKVIGAIYVIPFRRIIGADGGVLYSYAYKVYELFLDISTSGIPTAISMVIAEYNALKMINEREFAFTVAKKLVSGISITAFLVMFLFAGFIARFFVSGIDSEELIPSITLVIRVISFCLLIIPFLSVTRGYLQGNKYVSSSSSSQLIEQLVRVFVALAGSYIAINVLQQNVSVGVAVALSGTFLGGLFAFLFLKHKIKKNQLMHPEEIAKPNESTVTAMEIIKKMAVRAIPVIIIAATQNIYGIVDLKLLNRGLYLIGYDPNVGQQIASVVVTWVPKICMIINSIAVGMCLSIIPFIVESYTNNKKEELNSKFNQAINTIFYITIPLTVFIFAFNSQIYSIFYESVEYGGIILAANAILSILFSLQMVMDMMLQAMKNYKLVYLNTFVGLLLNAVLDIPFILLLNKLNFYPYLGSIFASMVGQTVSILIILIGSKIRYKFSFKNILKLLLHIILGALFMTLVVMLLKQINISFDNYIYNLIILGIYGLISIGAYMIITFIFGTMKQVLGEEFFDDIKNKFKKQI